MKTRYWILIIIALVLLGALLYFAAYAYSLKQVHIKDVEFNLANISLKGATVKGTVMLENKGLFDITIDKVSVDMNVGEERLGGAVLDGGEIPAGSEASYPVEIGIDWIPTAQAAIDLLQSDKEITVEGKAKFGVHALTFERKVDLTDYLLQFTTIKVKENLPNAKEAVEKVNQQLKDIFGH
ncbi:LEA type 2 family protein [Candidatus Woesearchaeota archaeon]|nr:LEA type 2 family protein [Candidatus Woesearchaeota archaeon]